MTYKFLPHTADVKIQVEEKTLDKAFSTAAMAMKEVIAEKIKIHAKIKKEINIESENKESLLYDFLEQFLVLLDSEGFVLAEVTSVDIKGENDKFFLTAEILGDNAKNYKFSNDVKAITYNDMKIEHKKGKTTIVFVLDV